LVRFLKVAVSAAFLLSCVNTVEALPPAAQRGLTFVRENCARCHSVDTITPSPLSIAPPFRLLYLQYPIENLRKPLGEGLQAAHPTMPQFQLDPGQVEDVIAYLKSLED